jgi:CcmD family protein
MYRIKIRHGFGLALFFALATALPLVAQDAALPGSAVAEQSLRPYAFVFIAYTIVWIFALGWIVAVARRLARLERRLEV